MKMKTRNKAGLKTREQEKQLTRDKAGYKAEVWSSKRKELPGGRSLVYRRISIYPTNTPRNISHVYRCGVGITDSGIQFSPSPILILSEQTWLLYLARITSL